jgi:hypothetical protein
MLLHDEASRFARVLTARLDADTLTAVIAQLLDHGCEESAFQPRAAYRKKHFKEALGGASESMWQALRAKKKIPPGKQISPNIEIWTHEQVLGTIAMLAEEQEQRQREQQGQK